MLRKQFYIFILILFLLSGCGASKPAPWYTQYGIPDQASLSKIESIPKLTKALDDEKPEVRANAAEIIGNFGPKAKQAGQKLFHLRTNDTSGTVRLFSHYALKEIFQGEYDGIYLNFKN